MRQDHDHGRHEEKVDDPHIVTELTRPSPTESEERADSKHVGLLG
jgi:hypothetical protein